ncbi:MAG: PP2C family protein-serine/threonine phosphatase [Bacteroidota bacterium]
MKRTSPTSASDSQVLPLLEFSKVVNSSLDLSFILGTLLLTLMGKLLITKGVVLLKIGHKKFSVKYGKGVPKELLMIDVVLPKESKKSFSATLKDSKGCEKLLQTGINRFFPIITHDNVIGYVGVAEHAQRPISKQNEQFVDTILNISAAAIEKGLAFDELKDVNRSLDGKVQQLKTLFELGKEFSGVLERERLLKLFSLTFMGQVGTNRFAICLKEGGSYYSRVSSEFLEKDRNVLCSLVTAPMFVSQIPKAKKFDELKKHAVKEKIAAFIPLQLQNEVKGVLCLGEKLRGGEYSENDLEYVFSLANLAFVSLENSRLFNEAIEKQKLENELLIAREIQQGLLPSILPSIEGFDISAVNISSKQVGGDYYDAIPTSDGKYVIVIGDVSGKGTPASLLMANVQATVHALVPFNLELSLATARINDLIHRNTSSDKFITFFWGSLDPKTKKFRYVNAGHNPPFVVRANGTIERLTEGGLILGIMKTLIPYNEGSVELHSGDSVILFTDGVSEAMDVNGNDYTEERLERFVQTLNGLSAEKILTAIKNEIQLYTAGAPQSDDITLVVFKAK